MGIKAIKLKPRGRFSRVMPFDGIPFPGTAGSEQLRGLAGK